MKIGIVGCAHGQLEVIYDRINSLAKLDLLLCCGDFQSLRNEDDLKCMASKNPDMGSFHKYYSGEMTAPILTIFIGGNHEASNYLQELPFGGWVAPNIYYLGYAGVVNVCGIRIAGISGIYKVYDYLTTRYEVPPYTEDSKRSVYHVRLMDVYKLKQLSNQIDIFLSHDWPRSVEKFGDFKQLMETRPLFRNDIENNTLGSPPSKELLTLLKPCYWFAAHMHVYFPADVPHKENGLKTKFLSLDKCFPENVDVDERKFIEILDINNAIEQQDIQLSYDIEWLTILYLTKDMKIPPYQNVSRSNFTPTKEEKELVLMKFDYNLIIPMNFCRSMAVYDPSKSLLPGQLRLQTNAQTTLFCNILDIPNPHIIAMNM